jgi:uncharacterized membrane protein YecN with MAPEG domain
MMPNAPLGAAMIHASLLLMMAVVLGALVVRRRRARAVGLGDGGDPALARAIRIHANFSEYAPFAIGAYILLALGGASAELIHALGAIFLAGRVCHAVGLHGSENASVGRTLGTAATFGVLGAAAIVLMVLALA